MSNTDIKLIHNEDENRFEKKVDGFLAYIEYLRKDNKMYLTHTIVPQEIDGRGVGTTLVRETLEEIEKRYLKVVPVCSFVILFIKRHPEWEKLL